jgi:hypothetical protein
MKIDDVFYICAAIALFPLVIAYIVIASYLKDYANKKEDRLKKK